MLNTDVLGVFEQSQRQQPGAVVVDMAGVRMDGCDAMPGSAPAADIAIIDWELLFNAVKARLRYCVGPGWPVEQTGRDASAQVKAQVLQCVEALDQLQTTMSHYIERDRTLARSLADTRSALAQARGPAGEHTVRYLAAHDSLSALPDRAGFAARLAQLMTVGATSGQTFALLCIDLGGLNEINDSHGHAVGDELLRLVAARLSGAVHSAGLVSRVGSGEIACLLWGGPPDRTALIRLAGTVSAPFQIGELSLGVQPSMGIAIWPTDGLTAESLLEHADAALVSAREQRSDHAYF